MVNKYSFSCYNNLLIYNCQESVSRYNTRRNEILLTSINLLQTKDTASCILLLRVFDGAFASVIWNVDSTENITIKDSFQFYNE